MLLDRNDPSLVSPAREVVVATVHKTLGGDGGGVEQNVNTAICARESILLESAINTTIAVEVTNSVSEGDWTAIAGKCTGKGKVLVNVDPVEICAAGDCLFHARETEVTTGGPSVNIARTTQVLCDGDVTVIGESHNGRVIISSPGKPPITRFESTDGNIWVKAQGELDVRTESRV